MRFIHAFIIVVALVPSHINATKSAVLSLDELYAISDQVLQVHIISGRENASDRRQCGVRYIGQIETSWKGLPKGAAIEFATTPSDPTNIGQTYIVYLAAQGNPKASPLASTIGGDLHAHAQWIAKCADVIPPYQVVHYRSMYPVWQVGRSESDLAVLFDARNSYIRLPQEFMTDNRGTVSYVALHTFDAYLKSSSARKSDRSGT